MIRQVHAPRGLSRAEVATRVADGRVNAAAERSSRSLRDIVRGNVLTSFNLVIGTMWIAMIVARAPFQDTLFGFVILLNSGIGIVQEWRAKRTLDRLSVLGEARPTVRRDGEDVEVTTNEIVQDDLLLLRSGDQVVVDAEVLESRGLEIDESLLTGEADPVAKVPGDGASSGSFVVAGSGLLRVTQVGADSYANQLAEQASEYRASHSELLSSIMRFVRIMTYVLVPIGILLFVSQLRADQTWQAALSGTVAGVVTMVPEGLVLLTSVAMAVAVVRLGRRRTLVQEMPAVETLARVDVMCVDKTGTLTEPGMSVRAVESLGGGHAVTDALGALGAAERDPNPTLAAVAAAGPAPESWSAQAVVPFSSERKWSAADFGTDGAWVLGAPELLLPFGATELVRAEELAGEGARVLLLARSDATEPGELPDADRGHGPLSPAALVVIAQRLRSDAEETVRYFVDQGVAVKVISGDNPRSVGAIAAAAGVPGAERTYDARGLPEDVESLARVVDEHSVFGRVTPAQKRRMVQALQSRGHVVAMTGDGVNDVLALKDADLGIAMGSGAGASRSVAQIVLLDNAWSVMPAVVAEGRRVLGNIERVSQLFLTKSFYAAALALMTGVVGLPFPFLPRHLSVIGWLTIGTPAFFLSLLPNTQVFRPGFLRRVIRVALPAGIVCAGSAFASYGIVVGQGDDTATARVAASIALFLVGWTVLLLVARPLDRYRAAVVAAMAVGFVLLMTVPPLARFFALQVHVDRPVLSGVACGVAGSLLLVGWQRVAPRVWPEGAGRTGVPTG